MFLGLSSFRMAAVLVVFAAAGALADPVTLRAVDSNFVTTGDLIGLEDGQYVIETRIGRLRIARNEVVCEGAACALAQFQSPDVTVAGSDTIGQGLMPLLLAGLAQSRDADVTQTDLSGLAGAFYQLTENQGFGDPMASFRVALGSSADAFSAMAAGRADLGLSTRAVQLTEITGLIDADRIADLSQLGETVIATDALAVIVHPDNPVSQISTADLAGIYAGRITNWVGLGGPDLTIVPFTRPETSSTRAQFETVIFDGDAAQIGANVQVGADDNTQMAQQIRQTPGGVGFTSVAFTRGNKIVTLENSCGITSQASRFTSKTEENPLGRRLYVYHTPAVPSDGRDLVAFAVSPQADDVIAKAGFVNFAVERQAREISPIEIAERLSALDDDAQFALTQQLLLDISQWDRLSTTFRFPAASVNLGGKARNDLARLVEYLSQFPDGTQVTLAGFTDADGSFGENVDLSRARALAVAQAIDAAGAERLLNVEFFVEGFGPLTPVACNTSIDDKAINRRVEVWIKTP